MIERVEFAQLIGNTVKMHLKDEDGEFRNHYHRYKSEDKAQKMYAIFKMAIEENDYRGRISNGRRQG